MRVTEADLGPRPAPPSDAPVFGRQEDTPGSQKLRHFGLQVQYRERGQLVREDVMFAAYQKMDAGAVLRMMQAGSDEMALAQATAVVLSTSLLDDDGVPSDWTPPGIDEPALEDEDDLDSRALRGEPTEVDPEGPLLYERWDGELVPYDDLDFDPFRDGSSRRRFSYIMVSTRYRVDLDALTDTAKWLVEQSAGRPTGRPTPSGRGPASTRRGFGGRQR